MLKNATKPDKNLHCKMRLAKWNYDIDKADTKLSICQTQKLPTIQQAAEIECEMFQKRFLSNTF